MKTKTHQRLVTFTVMLVAIIEILDMTIVNVALPHMMASLGANSSQITWVLTTYIVSAAVFMPMTGFLCKRFGQERLLSANIIGFCTASILCGIATSLPQMVTFRLLQGMFGASLVPLSQVILRQVYPQEEHTKAMAIWGVGIMAGPILGPTLGGIITDHSSWRWIFYLNVPICLLALGLSWICVPHSPKQAIRLDILSTVFLILSISCLQLFLDRGNEVGWLDDFSMLILITLATYALVLFVVRGFSPKMGLSPIINVRLFFDRNFSIACFIIMAFGISTLGTVALVPSLLQQLLGYSAQQAGLMMMPQAIASAVGMFLVSALIHRFDTRKIIALGLLLSATGAYYRSLLTLEVSSWQFIWPGILHGLGAGLFFVPITALAFQTLKSVDTAEASGVFNFFRHLGSSIGISVVITFLTRSTQINWHELGEHLSVYNPLLPEWLARLELTTESPLTGPILVQELARQASMIAHNSTFRLIALITIFMLPLLLLLKTEANLQQQERN